MTNHHGGPAANWGQVATESLRHPLVSGVADTVLGGSYTALGVATHNPICVVLGAAIAGSGIDKLHSFSGHLRYPEP